MFFTKKSKTPVNRYASTHNMRIKRGKKRYYAKSTLRRKIKRNLKNRGYGRKAQRRASKSGWA